MSREEHVALLEKEAISVAEIFEVNARFHLILAHFSGNQFIEEVIDQQNKLRRFVEYSHRWTEHPELSKRVCREHMAILDALENGDRKLASNLMWQHLDAACRVEKEISSGPVISWAQPEKTHSA